MMKKSICLVVLTLCFYWSEGQLQIPNVDGNTLSIDGQFEESLWDGCHSILMNEGAEVLLGQDEAFVYVGIRREIYVARYVDLYIQTPGTLLNLHASMQLGERHLTGQWDDSTPRWSWGNNSNWEANPVEIINDDDDLPFLETVAPYEGYEFRVSKSKLSAGSLRLRIELRDFMGKSEDRVYPISSTRYDVDSWLVINLD